MTDSMTPEKNRLFSHQRLFFVFTSLLYHSIAHPEHWFTGPIFTLPAYSQILGEAELKITSTQSTSHDIYNSNGALVGIPTRISTQMLTELDYGLTKNLDVAVEVPFIDNQYSQQSHASMGDTTLSFGIQLIDHRHETRAPNLRLILQETFPTGRYDRLLSSNNGTDATGIGSFQTLAALSVEHLTHFNEKHALMAHATVFYQVRSAVPLNGLSIYGGSKTTLGGINPGNVFDFHLAGEFTLTQHWVAVLESLFYYQQQSSFHGEPGLTIDQEREPLARHGRRREFFSRRLFPSPQNIGQLLIGSGNQNQLSLSPGIEYNVSEKLGIIAGAWFSLTGKNALTFASPALRLVARW